MPLKFFKPPEKKENTEDLWDEIGFHKTLAGFWFNLLYTLVGILISSFLMGTLMYLFYPYPESIGYRDVAFTSFQLIFVAFDLGTASIMDRFLGEENIKNPEKMLQLIQYFIWYQMITGLIQITTVIVYAVFFATKSNLAYASYIMIIAGTTQYPGFLGVFRNVLGSLQQYNKTQTLNFLTGTIVQRLTEVGFIFLFRYIGAQNPQIGELMGITIGSAIGLYVDDFIAMLVSAWYFSKAMQKYGIRPKDCFRPDFSWKDVKPVFTFALKTGIPGLVGPSLNLINLTIWLTYVPHYTSFLIIFSIGASIPDIVNWFGVPAITPLISESYLNGKKNLSQYYIGQFLRFRFLLDGFFSPLMIILVPVIPIAWTAMGMDNYMLGAAVIIPRLIMIIFQHIADIPGQVLFGANRPNWAIIAGFLNNVLNTVFLFLLLGVWDLPSQFGFTAIVWIYICYTLPLGLIFTIASYTWVHKKVLPIKIPVKQIFFGIILPSFLTFFLMYMGKAFIFDPVLAATNFYLAALATIPVLALVMIFFYFPMTAILGGWDPINLEEFRKTAWMSGPSKFVVMPLYWLLKKVTKKSPLHGRFQMSTENVIKDAQELLLIKRKNREELKEKLERERGK